MAMEGDRWSPGIGDPTVIGWVVVAAYAVAFVLCTLCVTRLPPDDGDRGFWRFIAILMLLLGINKQLDLQTWFTQTGRDLAMSEGWYGQRQKVQIAFIAWLAAAGIAGQWWLFCLLRRRSPELRVAAFGLLTLAAFVVMRAASFHHIDMLLGMRFGGVRLNPLIELSGIGCVAVAAWRRLRRWRAALRAPHPGESLETEQDGSAGQPRR